MQASYRKPARLKKPAQSEQAGESGCGLVIRILTKRIVKRLGLFDLREIKRLEDIAAMLDQYSTTCGDMSRRAPVAVCLQLFYPSLFADYARERLQQLDVRMSIGFGAVYVRLQIPTRRTIT
jgi:hypothetical protein